MTLYAATTNPGKLHDFAAAADVYGIRIAPLPELKEYPAPREDAPTFEGNARLKAIYYSTLQPGLVVLADDSGLEADALNGLPGVRSARFADDFGYTGNGSQDERNNALLLEKMDGQPNRTARYRCTLVLASDGQVFFAADGTVEGTLTSTPRGDGGFGYDPLFQLPDGRTMAEVSLDEKQTFSHRGRALAALLKRWKQADEAR